MFQGLTSHQAFVEDVAAAERWYSDLLGIEPYFRSEDVGLPAGHVGFRVGDMQSELGLTDRKLAPDGVGTGPAATIAYLAGRRRGGCLRSSALPRGEAPPAPDGTQQGIHDRIGGGPLWQRSRSTV